MGRSVSLPSKKIFCPCIPPLLDNDGDRTQPRTWVGFGVYNIGGAVGGARKKYKVPYPYLYADMAKCEGDSAEAKAFLAFNNAQRGHQNTLESLAMVFVFAMIAGIVFPLYQAIVNVVYIVGCVLYYVGYTAGPGNRYKKGGVLKMLAMIASLILACASAAKVSGLY